MTDNNGFFSRTERLVGAEAMDRLGKTNVLIVGVGGVGSWCAEGLVRSGITEITIADPDIVVASNVNRQLMATSRTLGQPKVAALARRLMEINPSASITVVQEKFTAETAGSFNLGQFDYIIDAIDSIPDKASLILKSLETDATLFSSMGAALKSDLSRISVAEFWKVHGCPLAKALRERFRKSGQFPCRKFYCVFSDERLVNHPSEDESGNGTSVFITASFGFRLASMVFNDAAGL